MIITVYPKGVRVVWFNGDIWVVYICPVTRVNKTRVGIDISDAWPTALNITVSWCSKVSYLGTRIVPYDAIFYQALTGKESIAFIASDSVVGNCAVACQESSSVNLNRVSTDETVFDLAAAPAQPPPTLGRVVADGAFSDYAVAPGQTATYKKTAVFFYGAVADYSVKLQNPPAVPGRVAANYAFF